MDRYDALVIGGGPAGAAAAQLLARAGWRVGLLEHAVFPRRKVCGEFLSAGNLPLLHELGVGAAFEAEAGADVRQIGLFSGRAMLTAPLARIENGSAAWGRALGRERLDTLLLQQAQQAGVELWQPWKALQLNRVQDGYLCRARHTTSGETATLRTAIVIAAHGSWEPGQLPTQPPHRAPQGGDLLGFKAHFRHTTLAPGLMPLLAFPGGYGGMVHSDGGRVSLSCCIRRDTLQALRQPGESAGEAVLRHLRRCCLGVELALAEGAPEQGWLAAGPIRPGLHAMPATGIFAVGNACGETHPIIAEGISMALQSAWLLSEVLVADRSRLNQQDFLAASARRYRAAWRRHFLVRLYASSLFAQLAMRPLPASLLLPLFRHVPGLLTAGARLAGKAALPVMPTGQ